MDKLNPLRTGSALALAAGTISLICALAVFLFPDGMINFVNAWFHGLDLNLIRSNKPWTLGEFTYGLFGATITGFLSGVIFAISFNLVGSCYLACQRTP
ncbi:MAG: hypothetical protein HZB95_02940 [Nitrosomonadales bacterium]|nr:hypothetical protein [Nitrosomonadales bacterium]